MACGCSKRKTTNTTTIKSSPVATDDDLKALNEKSPNQYVLAKVDNGTRETYVTSPSRKLFVDGFLYYGRFLGEKELYMHVDDIALLPNVVRV